MLLDEAAVEVSRASIMAKGGPTGPIRGVPLVPPSFPLGNPTDQRSNDTIVLLTVTCFI